MSLPTKYTKEILEKIIKESVNIAEVLEKLNLQAKGGNYKIFYRNVKKFTIDISHLESNKNRQRQKLIREKISDKEIIESIKNHISFSATLISLGLSDNSGSNYKWLHKKIKDLNINTSHHLGSGHLKGKSHNYNQGISLDEILIINSSHIHTSSLKTKLIKSNLLQNKCYNCGIDSWNQLPISLHLDHINGINNDNRIENLRLLCPNCHSQTETYAGKNKNKKSGTTGEI